MASSSDSMDNTFRARVQKIFGSLSSSSLSPPWCLTDGEVEKREWRRPSSAKDDDQTPISLSFDGLACRVVRFRHERRLSVKRGAQREKAGKKPAAKKGKAAKDPNKPKRPASAFFVFMEEFRKTYKEKHPNNKSVAAVSVFTSFVLQISDLWILFKFDFNFYCFWNVDYVGKAGGDKWKSLSEAEKAPYVAKAEKRKTEYNKTLEAYNKKMIGCFSIDSKSTHFLNHLTSLQFSTRFFAKFEFVDMNLFLNSIGGISGCRMEMEPGKLFIGGISWDTNEDRLREYFQTFGEVVEAVIMKDRNTGRARGFGFVVFANPSVAERVVREKHIIDGRTISCAFELKFCLSLQIFHTYISMGNFAYIMN
ncbi:hypothetical protein ACSBR2_037370 [Camellia fascicularis]